MNKKIPPTPIPIKIPDTNIHITLDGLKELLLLLIGNDKKLNHISNELILTNTKLNHIMAKVDDIKTLVEGINESTNNIAADLERIAGGLEGGLSSDEADGVIAELQAAADKLKAVADINQP